MHNKEALKMSIHPSLNSSDADSKVRSVLKRTERLKIMHDKNLWKEGEKVSGLPKIKTLRIKVVKKEKAAKTETPGAEGAAAAAPAAGAKAAPAAKGAAPKK